MAEPPDRAPSPEPQADAPRMFGSRPDSTPLRWTWATERLTAARNYWISTTRLDGRPHARPVWAIWLDGACYFSTGSLAATHLPAHPDITVHLESGNEVVIIEGRAHLVDDRELIIRIVDVYNAKYHWDMDPDELPGPFYAVKPTVAFGWISDDTGLDRGAAFEGSATRWKF
jgi:hypothetical protein